MEKRFQSTTNAMEDQQYIRIADHLDDVGDLLIAARSNLYNAYVDVWLSVDDARDLAYEILRATAQERKNV